MSCFSSISQVTGDIQDHSCVTSQRLWETTVISPMAPRPVMDMRSAREVRIYHYEALRLWGHLLLRHGQSCSTEAVGVIFPHFKNYAWFLETLSALLTTTEIESFEVKLFLFYYIKQNMKTTKNMIYQNNVNFLFILPSCVCVSKCFVSRGFRQGRSLCSMGIFVLLLNLHLSGRGVNVALLLQSLYRSWKGTHTFELQSDDKSIGCA